MASSDASAQDHFQAIAANYERATGGATRVVARHIVSAAPAINSDSTILDNACGSGIIIEEIFAAYASSAKATIEAADASTAMIDLLKYKIQQNGWQDVHAKALPGEALDYPEASFTHSFTNFGIFFFKDPVAGAKQLYKTLKPGGTALLSTWHDVGYLEPFRRVEARLRPNVEKKEFPIRQEWESGEYAKRILVQGGFDEDKVRTYEQPSYMQAKDLDTLVDNLSVVLKTFIEDWSDDEKAKFEGELVQEIGAQPGLVENADDGIRVKMVANVLVCVKES